MAIGVDAGVGAVKLHRKRARGNLQAVCDLSAGSMHVNARLVHSVETLGPRTFMYSDCAFFGQSDRSNDNGGFSAWDDGLMIEKAVIPPRSMRQPWHETRRAE